MTNTSLPINFRIMLDWTLDWCLCHMCAWTECKDSVALETTHVVWMNKQRSHDVHSKGERTCRAPFHVKKHTEHGSLHYLKWTRIRIKIKISLREFQGHLWAALLYFFWWFCPWLEASRPKRLTVPIPPTFFWLLWLRTSFHRKIDGKYSCESEPDL